jgi:hypothetical protein
MVRRKVRIAVQTNPTNLCRGTKYFYSKEMEIDFGGQRLLGHPHLRRRWCV